jgi:c-di-GMP-binding flagellar brake protein YcgR
MRYYERERREFVRIRIEVPVRYRFLSHDPAFEPSEPFLGVTRDLSGGGLLLRAAVPDDDWIPGILSERIFLGVEIELEGEPQPVRALTRAAWVRAEVEGSSDGCLMGLRFKEITREDLDRVFRFVIAKQMD